MAYTKISDVEFYTPYRQTKSQSPVKATGPSIKIFSLLFYTTINIEPNIKPNLKNLSYWYKLQHTL